ncbi:hypothetical protein PHISP_02450 [Aspergillus sp. HF37]|nr:hypothetical protein PHISP_02450 [Aspergillus sp. HF37]
MVVRKFRIPWRNIIAQETLASFVICLELAFHIYLRIDFDNGSLEVVGPSLPTCPTLSDKEYAARQRRSGQHDVTKQAIATLQLWAVINIGDRDFPAALSYVAISRVKSLDGQLIEDTFGYDRCVRTLQGVENTDNPWIETQIKRSYDRVNRHRQQNSTK